MIRTKKYITIEIKRLEANRDRLKEELSLLNGMVKQIGQMPFTNSKRVINHELILIEGKLAFADWCANTSEKSLPKIKEKKKKRKKDKTPELKKSNTIAVYPKETHFVNGRDMTDNLKSNKDVIDKTRKK